MGRFKVGYCGKRRSLLGRLFEKNLELTPATTLQALEGTFNKKKAPAEAFSEHCYFAKVH